MGKKTLDIKNLNVSFVTRDSEIHVLNGVNISVEQGEILGIVGESGSGKSVTAYAVLKLLDKSAKIQGEILLNETDIAKYTDKQMRSVRGNKISIIFQDPMTSLNPVYTIGNQLIEAIGVHYNHTNETARRKAAELLKLVGISDSAKRMKQYPHELSGGMRQRVVIAMALACEPDILIADEPTTALDVTVQAQILDLLRKLSKSRNMSTILITHDLGVIVDMCDHVVVMYAGRICEKGSVDDIFYNPRHEYTKGLLHAVPDGDVSKPLVPIAGAAVNLKNVPAGCAFSSRCARAMQVCVQELPEEKQISDGHFASCWINEMPTGLGEEINDG